MIEAENLAAMIEKQIRQSLDSFITIYIKRTIEELTLDPEWIGRVERSINQEFSHKFAEKISMLDFNSLVSQHLDASLDQWKNKLLKDFRTSGIIDSAETTELTVLPGAVVAEHDLISSRLQTHGDAEIMGTANIKNLVVTGVINTDNSSWNELSESIAEKALEKIGQQWCDDLCQQILDLARTQGIDFSNITLNGSSIVDGNTLNPSITETNIKKTATLRDLTVAGETHLADTVSVLNKRVGINTQQPEMALGIWDEEVSLVAGKLKQQQAYVGTSRLQSMSIGVNRVPYIEIDTEGIVKLHRLKVDQWKIEFSDQPPGHSGTRGDILFNTDPKPGAPFAWQCLGGHRWQAIRNAG